MNTIDELDVQLKKMLTSRDVFVNHISRKDMSAYMEFLINNHKVVLDSVNLFGDNYMKAMADTVRLIKSPTTSDFATYIEFKNKLDPKAKAAEAIKTLSVIIDVNEQFIKILDEVKDKISEYFTTDKINMFNMRISHVILLGVLYQSEQFSTFSKYMITLLSFASQNNLKEFPKYRLDFIKENLDEMVECVNAISEQSGATNVAKYVKNIKIDAKDFTLLSESNTVQVKQAGDLKLSENNKNLIASGTRSLFGFKWLGEKINLIAFWRERHRISEEEWLKAHVALLMSRLDGVDENSVEFIKLKKVIERYEEMINKYERKRNKKG